MQINHHTKQIISFSFEGNFYFTKNINETWEIFITKQLGLNKHIISLLLIRLELKIRWILFRPSEVLFIHLYIILSYLQLILPPRLSFFNQKRLNLYRYYLIKSRRGIFYAIKKPLHQRTRSKTYQAISLKKPNSRRSKILRRRKKFSSNKKVWVRETLQFSKKSFFSFIY